MNPHSRTSPDAESPEQLQAILDTAADGIILIDHAGSIQGFNCSAERLFGFDFREVVGRNVGMLMTEKDRGPHDNCLSRYVATRVPHIIGKGREVDAQRKDGSVFPVFLSIGAVLGTEPPRFIGIVHDITARRQTEEDAMRLSQRLMHVSRLVTIGEMAAGVAHEINQPLAAIATYAHACDRLLSVPHPEIEEIQLALRQIADQAVRAGDIIRRLRSLARDDHTQRGPTDINAVITELTDLILSEAKSQAVEYRVDLAIHLPKLTVHRTQIQQVVLNLVHNSLEAFALGKVAPREIIVRTRPTPQGDVEIRVCDNGPGIQSKIADRMFDPFYSTKRAGTGLGLAISRTIAHSHHGALDYQPNVPAGACFVLRIPSVPPEDS